MTTTTDHEIVADAIADRAAAIEAALATAGDAVDPAVVLTARADLETVRARLDLGVEHTVVALVGGTGSGKSSLFNAVSGLDFADVGVLRPTTDRAAACTWGDDATTLLDFLGVAPGRRIRRDTPLDGEAEADLHGVVLLDMPDHDSVATAHWSQVDRLLPLVDVLVWVVDPQKYADHVLHERYLRELGSRRDAMVVVVNHVDTLPEGGVGTILEDVHALLDRDGLGDVQVIAVSATQRTGVAELRGVLAAAAARPSVAARTAAAALDALAARLATEVGEREPELGPAAVGEATDALARAAGVDAVADSVTAAVRRGGAVARPETPAGGTVAAVRSAWLARASTGLPDRWSRVTEEAVAPASALRHAVATAVAGVPVPDATVRAARPLTVTGAVLALAGILGAVTLLVLDAGPLAALLAAVVGLGAGAALVIRAARLRRREAGARSAAYAAAARRAVERVVRDELEAPTAQVLERHRALREAMRTR